MLSQSLRFFQDSDVQLTAVGLRQPGKLDRARESGRPRADDQDVEVHAVAGTCGAVLENQCVEG